VAGESSWGARVRKISQAPTLAHIGGSVIAEGHGASHVVAVRIRPKPALIRSGLLVLLIVPLPIFGVLIFEGATSGSWPIGVGGELVCLLLCVFSVVRFRATFVEVNSTSIVERGFFGGRTHSNLSDIGDMVIAQTYSNSTADTLPQLIARDHQGKRVLRLRGVFWTEESMRAITTAAGLPFEELAEPLTSAEFFRRFPGAAYWFENRREVVVAAVAVISIVCVGIVLGLMQVLDSPVNGP
jgi:hypothetical protein